MPASVPVITIDGPSGVGKGTLARLLAIELGWHLLDSGALYRLTALAAQQRHITISKTNQLADLAADLPVAFCSDGSHNTLIFLNNKDVSLDIRSEECGNMASKIAALSAVRQALLQRQHAFRQAPGLVADGRDMGTVVFPDAIVKLFLTASAEERAIRRYKQLKEQGINASLAALKKDIAERDCRDSQRQIAPLKPAADAITLDTSSVTSADLKQHALALIKAKL